MMNRNMMKQAQQLQKQMLKAQQEIESSTVEFSSGGGAVKVVVSGKMIVESVLLTARAEGKNPLRQMKEISNILKLGKIKMIKTGDELPDVIQKLLGPEKNIKASEVFDLYRKKNTEACKIIEEYKENLAISLSSVINILDPDAIVFGGGVSNEITFLDEIKEKIEKYLNEGKINTAFIKPMYGDASGVRGAARLGRKINY